MEGEAAQPRVNQAWLVTWTLGHHTGPCTCTTPCTNTATTLYTWKNGKEVSRWGVAEIQKMSTSTTAAAVLSNKGVVEFWEM